MPILALRTITSYTVLIITFDGESKLLISIWSTRENRVHCGQNVEYGVGYPRESDRKLIL